MAKIDAIKALEIYKRAGQQVQKVRFSFFYTMGQLTGSWDSMMWFCLFYRQKGFLLFMTTANVLSWLGLSSFLLWGRYAHSLIHPYLNDRLHPDIDFQCTKKDKIHEIDCAITSAFVQTWQLFALNWQRPTIVFTIFSWLLLIMHVNQLSTESPDYKDLDI
jgi:hypothetical protein